MTKPTMTPGFGGPKGTLHMWAYGDALLDNPEVWFSEEFLHRPLDGFTVDMVTDPLQACGIYSDWGKYHKGTVIKLPERQRIWVLTGDYDYERNGYLGRWPD